MTIFRAIDMETTGIPTPEDKHAIVEIGWCDLEDGDVGIPDAVLCNPGRPIPHDAMAVHHITDEDVQDATGSTEELGRPDYFVAHFADYERQFFETDVPFICTWKVALRLWPDSPHHGLQFLRYHLALPVLPTLCQPPHRAAPDAYVCAVLMQRILAENKVSVEDMVRWSNGPALMPRITFGKHASLKYEDVPTSYLDWMLTDPKFSTDPTNRDHLANARYHLKKRAAQENPNG